MIANVSWNMTNTVSGIVPLTVPTSTPVSQARENPPTSPGIALSPKANEYPNASHSTDTTQQIEKHCISTDSTLRLRTRPP